MSARLIDSAPPRSGELSAAPSIDMGGCWSPGSSPGMIARERVTGILTRWSRASVNRFNRVGRSYEVIQQVPLTPETLGFLIHSVRRSAEPGCLDRPHGERWSAPGWKANRLVEAFPAADEQCPEQPAIAEEDCCRCSHPPPRSAFEGVLGIRKPIRRPLGKRVADLWQRRLRQYIAWHRRKDAVRLQQLARQVEAVPAGIPGEVAQDAG
jgi:hypothetical protein